MKTVRKYTSCLENWDIIITIREVNDREYMINITYDGVDTPPARYYESTCLEEAISFAKDML